MGWYNEVPRMVKQSREIGTYDSAAAACAPETAEDPALTINFPPLRKWFTLETFVRCVPLELLCEPATNSTADGAAPEVAGTPEDTTTCRAEGEVGSYQDTVAPVTDTGAVGASTTPPAETPSRDGVLCMTGDYTMQNILVRLGLQVLVRDDAARMRRFYNYVMLCYTCRTVTRNMATKFCPMCGG
uniref:20S-pre-rRNA D-site endonuclease nob1 n=1 Tax=Lygus hesperus TaxID=30085 RepID=A0A0A9YN81_LYGHE